MRLGNRRLMAARNVYVAVHFAGLFTGCRVYYCQRRTTSTTIDEQQYKYIYIQYIVQHSTT